MSKKNSNSTGGNWALKFIILILVMYGVAFEIKYQISYEKGKILLNVIPFIIVVEIANRIVKFVIDCGHREFLEFIQKKIGIEDVAKSVAEYDDLVVVESRQALAKYDDVKYLRSHSFAEVKKLIEEKKKAIPVIDEFLNSDNGYNTNRNYAYAEQQLLAYRRIAEDGYSVLVRYLNTFGRTKGQRVINITSERIDELAEHPETLMTKAEHNKMLADEKKDDLKDRVGKILDLVSSTKDTLKVPNYRRKFEDIERNFFSETEADIKKFKSIDSEEYRKLLGTIDATEKLVYGIIENDKKITDYYSSEDFKQIKENCSSLILSHWEFKTDIDQKVQETFSLFNRETEVSKAVFSKAKAAPLEYVIRKFYSTKDERADKLDKIKAAKDGLTDLRKAIEKTEKLKQEYAEYIETVPGYVLDGDEVGLYSRLGLPEIDESVLKVGYSFICKNEAGRIQKNFTIFMTDENIAKLIDFMEQY